MSYVGDAIAPTLVDTHPAWLMALNSRTRNLALVTNEVDPWTFYGIGMTRLLLSDPLFFLLGYWYGDAAVTWMERRTNTWGTMLRQVEQWFGELRTRSSSWLPTATCASSPGRPGCRSRRSSP